MYDIYIKNYTDASGNFVSSENLLYSIPFNKENPNILIDPIVKTEMGKTGSFEFSVYPNHPYFNAWLQMKTIMRVVYDGDTLFRGRVLTIDNSPMTGARKIHLEGDMAFLMDSQQEGTKDTERPEQSLSSYLQQVITSHNNQMDADGEYEKRIFLGEVPGHYSSSINAAQQISGSKTERFGSSGWRTTMDALNELPKQYGGYFRTRCEEDHFSDIGRYGRGNIDLNNRIVVQNPDGSISTERSFSVYMEDDDKEVLLPTVINGAIKSEEFAIQYYLDTGEHLGKFDTPEEAESYAVRLHQRQEWHYSGVNYTITYLDWLNNSFRYVVNSQVIRLSENLIDISDQMEVENLFTALIPIGSSKGNNIYVEGYRDDIHGHNKRILVPQIVGLFTDSELNVGYHNKSDYQNAVNQYGIIYKAQSFSNASTQAELWSQAIEWIKDNYFGGINTFNLTALDMHHLNVNAQKFLTGDRVRVMYPDMFVIYDSELNRNLIEKTLTFTSIQYNLHNPDRNLYTIGKPSMLVNKKYGSSNSKKSSAQSSGSNQNHDDTDAEHSAEIQELTQEAWNYIVNAKYNSEEYAELMARDPTGKTADLALHGSFIGLVEGFIAGESHPTSGIHKRRLQNILLNGVKASAEFAGPVDRSLVRDEDVPVINAMNRTMIFDGLKQRFGLKTAMDLSIPDYRDIPLKTRLELKLDGNANSAQVKTYKPGKEPESLLPTEITSMLDGSEGMLSSMKNIVGLDGSGEKGTILQDGAAAMAKFFDPSSVQSGGTPKETAQINGGNGTAKVGKDASQNWQVKLNEEVTYTDADGVQRTAKGFVSAKDFNVPEISSFKTKIGIFDIVIAGKVEAQQIHADLGEVRKWLGDTIVANTGIRTDRLHSNRINATSYELNVPSSGGSGYDIAYLQNSFSNCLAYAGTGSDSGKIFLEFYKIGGGLGQRVNFNIADTQFYKNGVEAAYERGYEDGGGGGGGDVSFVASKCYATSVSSPQATDDDGNYHNCKKVKSLGTIDSSDKSIRVIFKVGSTQYNYYFGINGN